MKQTVMTSVYGVTYVGAREQIKRRLEEKGLITDDRLLFTAACYAAKVSNLPLEQLGLGSSYYRPYICLKMHILL